jgi:hypothetical protein
MLETACIGESRQRTWYLGRDERIESKVWELQISVSVAEWPE